MEYVSGEERDICNLKSALAQAQKDVDVLLGIVESAAGSNTYCRMCDSTGLCSVFEDGFPHENDCPLLPAVEIKERRGK